MERKKFRQIACNECKLHAMENKAFLGGISLALKFTLEQRKSNENKNPSDEAII